MRRASVFLGIWLALSACSSPTPPNPMVTPSGATTPAATGQANASQSPLPAAAPTTRELIAAALAAGRIDEPTALEYRIFALFNDSRLPAEFKGAAALTVDSAALGEAHDRLAALPPAIAATLRPYTVRPNDPESIFSRLSVAPVPSPGAIGRNLLAAARLGPQIALELAPCYQGWTAVPSLNHPFEVWARCAEGWTEADPALLEDLQTLVDMVDSIWKRESTFMNIEPLLDEPGSPEINDNDRIDVYLVDNSEGIIDGRDLHLAPNWAAFATATPTSESSAHGASGYLVLARARMNLGLDTFRSDVIHEFFHILEDARNVQSATSAPWFREASAVWAESFFQPETAATEAHKWFPDFIHHPELSLTDDSGNHSYQDYIWPFFMEEKFGPTSISQVWMKLGKLPGSESDVLNAISDVVGGFPAVFRDFTVRNFNQDLDAADKDAPAKPLHQAWVNIGAFPNSTPPYKNSDVTQHQFLTARSDPIEFPDSIDSLSAHYYSFAVDDSIGQVVFDFAGFGPHDALDVDALVAIKDQSKPEGVRWERRRIEGVPDQLKFCRNDPKNNVKAIYLILTNHDKDPNVKVGDTFKVSSPATPCAAGQITYHQTTTEKSASEASVEDDTLTISLNLVFKDGKVVNDGGSWTFNGRYDYTGGSPDCPSTVHATYSGTGTWVDNGEPQEGIGTIGFAINGNVPMLVGWVVPHSTSVTNDCLRGTKTTEGPFPIPWTFTITGQPIDPNGGPYDMGSSADYTNASRGQVHVESHGTIVAPTGSG